MTRPDCHRIARRLVLLTLIGMALSYVEAFLWPESGLRSLLNATPAERDAILAATVGQIDSDDADRLWGQHFGEPPDGPLTADCTEFHGLRSVALYPRWVTELQQEMEAEQERGYIRFAHSHYDKITIDCAGWPMYCTYGANGFLEDGSVFTRGMLENSPRIFKHTGSPRFHWPLIPLWWGLIGNGICHLPLVWGAIHGVPRARRFLRRRAGVCERCSYPRRDLIAACSECGHVPVLRHPIL